MNITQVNPDLDDIASNLRGHPEVRDNEGYHVTDLYWEGQRISKNKSKPDYSALDGIAELGKLWEYAVRPTILNMYPNSVVIFSPTYDMEGVKASLDGAIYGVGGTPEWIGINLVLECKLKLGKIITPDTRSDWMFQIKSYCHIIGARSVLMPVLFIQFGPPKAIPVFYHITFTDQEIAENWSTLINTRNYLEKEKRGNL